MLQIVCRGKADSQQFLPMSFSPCPHIPSALTRPRNAECQWLLSISFAPVSTQHFCTLGLRSLRGKTNTGATKKVSWLKWLTQQHAQRLQQQQGQKRILLIHLPLSQDDPFSSNSPFPLFFSPCTFRFYRWTGILLKSIRNVQSNLERELSALIKDYIIMNICMKRLNDKVMLMKQFWLFLTLECKTLQQKQFLTQEN